MDQYLIYLYEIYEMLLKKEMDMQQEKRAKFDLQGYMRENPSPYGNLCINIYDVALPWMLLEYNSAELATSEKIWL